MPDKQPRELTLAAATKRLIAIRRGIPDDLAKPRQKVLDDAAEREGKVLRWVPEEARGIVRRKADAECPVDGADSEPQPMVECDPAPPEVATTGEIGRASCRER